MTSNSTSGKSLHIPKGFCVKAEEHVLPTVREELVEAIRKLLEGGRVVKLVVEVGKRIQVRRLVEDKAPDDPQEGSDDLMCAVRNAEVRELDFDDLPGDPVLHPYLAVFQTFAAATARNLLPKVILVSQVRELQQWLGIPKSVELSELYCVPIAEHPDIPQGTMLLVAHPPGDPEMVVMSFRVEMGPPLKRGVA